MNLPGMELSALKNFDGAIGNLDVRIDLITNAVLIDFNH
jgi:hypothetical protein